MTHSVTLSAPADPRFTAEERDELFGLLNTLEALPRSSVIVSLRVLGHMAELNLGATDAEIEAAWVDLQRRIVVQSRSAAGRVAKLRSEMAGEITVQQEACLIDVLSSGNATEQGARTMLKTFLEAR